MSNRVYLLTITQTDTRSPLPIAAFTSELLARAEANAYARTHKGVKRVWEKGRDYRVLCGDRAELRVQPVERWNVRVRVYNAPVFSGEEW